MWICDNCKTTTQEPNIYREPHPYGDTVCYEIMFATCGCGGQYEEAEQCPTCEEWQIEGDFRGMCENCKDELLTVDNMLQYVKDKELQQDYFVEYWTGANVTENTRHLTGICERDWDFVYKSHYSENAESSLREFVTDDLDAFAKWYIEKE